MKIAQRYFLSLSFSFLNSRLLSFSLMDIILSLRVNLIHLFLDSSFPVVKQIRYFYKYIGKKYFKNFQYVILTLLISIVLMNE